MIPMQVSVCHGMVSPPLVTPRSTSSTKRLSLQVSAESLARHNRFNPALSRQVCVVEVGRYFQPISLVG